MIFCWLVLSKLEYPKPWRVHAPQHPWKLRKEKCWNSPVQGFLDEPCNGPNLRLNLSYFFYRDCGLDFCELSIPSLWYNKWLFRASTAKLGNQSVRSFTWVAFVLCHLTAPMMRCVVLCCALCTCNKVDDDQIVAHALPLYCLDCCLLHVVAGCKQD